MRSRILRISISIIILVIIDQASKYFVKTNFYSFTSITVIKNFFNLIYVKNRGVAFGLLSTLPQFWKKVFLIWLPCFACAALIIYIFFSKKISKLSLIGYTLIISGAIGNLLDRTLYGYVVDFFDIYYKSFHWPAFNFADSYITIGIIVIFIEIFIHKK